MEESKSHSDLPEAIDLAHHLSSKSRSRHVSPLKDSVRLLSVDGMISLAGGLPHPSLFPIQSFQFTCLTPNAPIIPDTTVARSEEDLMSISLKRNNAPGTLDITPFLQYGSGAGNKQLIDFVRKLTDRVHKPLYQYDCILHPGNTNAWFKVVELLCEDGDYILVEEFTYPSAQAVWIPTGKKSVPIGADDEGMSAAHLESTLSGWEKSGKAGKRPRVLYLVSVGSNPTGLSISAQRRKEIYDVCVKYDIVIVEDDPYFFLQYPAFSLSESSKRLPTTNPETFLSSLVPSFLSLDHQGRVIRLESFSKTIFPGLRLGYFIANPGFTERLLRATEVETQDPAGLSQAFALALLTTWKLDGYLDWVQNICSNYYMRRGWLLESISRKFSLVESAQSPVPTANGLVACLKSAATDGLKPVFSFVAPVAGMFLWTKFYFGDVERFQEILATDSKDPEQEFADEIWEALTKELVLLTPGSYYNPWQGPDIVTTKARGAEPATAHFRLSFSAVTKGKMDDGVDRLARVLEGYYLAGIEKQKL